MFLTCACLWASLGEIQNLEIISGVSHFRRLKRQSSGVRQRQSVVARAAICLWRRRANLTNSRHWKSINRRGKKGNNPHGTAQHPQLQEVCQNLLTQQLWHSEEMVGKRSAERETWKCGRLKRRNTAHKWKMHTHMIYNLDFCEVLH